MSNHSRRALRRTATAAIAALAGASSIALVPGSAGALPGFEFERVDGADRFGTAAEIALEAFPGGASDVILATGRAFPDALAGNFLAGSLGAPILLAEPDDVPAETVDALAALGADTVTLLGGPVALSAGVAAELSGLGYAVDRISGEDRFDTARRIAVHGAPSPVGEIDGKETAILATGENFPDALAVGPVAYDQHFPILLTPTNSLSPAATAAIDELNIEHVVILGGPVAISAGVESAVEALGVTTERIDGATRFSTATEIAERAIADFGFSETHVDVASGRNFPDALAGGPLGGVETAPLVLTEPNEAADETCDFLQDHAGTLATGHLLGGTLAVNTQAAQQLRQCAGGEAPNEEPRANQDFNSSPSSPVLGVLGTDGIARQVYTFSDILPGTKVDITFVPCFAVTRDNPARNVAIADDPVPQDFLFNLDLGENDDRVTLADYLGQSHSSFLLTPSGATVILFLNGEIPPGGPTPFVDDFVVPASGAVEVELAAEQGDCAVPLVYDDADGDDVLDLTPDTNLPIDPFAVGGAFLATNGEAGDGQEIDGDVMFINKDENYFVLDDRDTTINDGNVFYYGRAGDTYRYDATAGVFFGDEFPINEARWETYLSPLDEIDDTGPDVDYGRDGGNVFEIDDDYAGTVTGVTVQMGDFDDDPGDSTPNDARIRWNTPNPVDGFIVDYEVDLYDEAGVFLFFAGFDSDDDPDGTVPETNQDVNNDQIDDDVDNEIIVEDLPEGNYSAVVFALTASGDESLFGSEPNAIAAHSPGAPGAPISTVAQWAEVINPANGIVDAGDVLLFTFNENMALSGGDIVILRDADGTVGFFQNGLNANFGVGPGANQIFVDIIATLITVPGANGVLNSPATVISSTGIIDVGDGLEWNLLESPDREI